MNSKEKERYIRWQDYRITQLSFSINLFLGFSIASLAYVINLKINNTSGMGITGLFYPICWWSASSLCGVISTVSRLLDFRYTAKKIKEGGTFNALMSDWCGKITWGVFWAQIITYCVGAYKFIYAVFLL